MGVTNVATTTAKMATLTAAILVAVSFSTVPTDAFARDGRHWRGHNHHRHAGHHHWRGHHRHAGHHHWRGHHHGGRVALGVLGGAVAGAAIASAANPYYYPYAYSYSYPAYGYYYPY